MNVEQARQTIKEAVTEQVEICKENGFTVSGKVYFSDKALRECTEFNENIILIFGAIKLGLADMDEEDFCTYGLCCEIKTGLVNDEELEREIADFKSDVQKMLAEIAAAPSPIEKIKEINLRQEKEAEESMREFDKEMRKMKLKLYSALGALAAIAATIIIVGFFI